MPTPNGFPVEAGWRTILCDLGLEPANVLRRARLPEDLFSRGPTSLDTEEYFRLWEAMEAELETLKTQLAQAEAERDQALEDLQATVVALNEQIRETTKAKNEAARYKDLNTKHSWDSFLANAKIAVCGELWVSGRGRQRRCNEAVEEALGPDIKRQFEQCVDSYQSTPLFLRAETDTLPAFATAVPSNRFTRNRWYIQFCDPTLPEGTQQDLESFQPAAEGGTNAPAPNADDAPSWDDLDDIFEDDLDDLPD